MRIKKSSIFFNHTTLISQKNHKNIIKITSQIVKSGKYFNGLQTKKLEQQLDLYFKNGYITTVASGHDALSLSLSVLNPSADDEVIFPVNSYPTAFPIALSGARPIGADVDENGQLNPRNLAGKISNKTKAVVLVYLYGLTGNVNAIKALIKGKEIAIIEDCAQAFGTLHDNQAVGTLGDIGCFSFYPTKNLATLGDGGALWTKHKKYYEYFLKAKLYGEEKRYYSIFLSGHSRIPEIQSGILNLYFKRIRKEFQKRREVAKEYREEIERQGLSKFVRCLISHRNSDPVQHLFVIEVIERDRLRKHLVFNNIETHIHYPYPIHLLPAFSHLGYKKGDFPIAERLSNNILSLPFHQFMTKNDIKKIVKIIKNFYG